MEKSLEWMTVLYNQCNQSNERKNMLKTNFKKQNKIPHPQWEKENRDKNHYLPTFPSDVPMCQKGRFQ